MIIVVVSSATQGRQPELQLIGGVGGVPGVEGKKALHDTRGQHYFTCTVVDCCCTGAARSSPTVF